MDDPIHLVAIGEPDRLAMEAIDEALREELGVPLHRSPIVIDPAFAYDPRRDQYSSRAVLGLLLDCIEGGGRALGIAEVDLFMPILTFVFGEAQLGGRSAVVSLHRLHDEFYGLPESVPRLQDRAVKEALHEIGHTYGLVHCPNYRCVMRASRTVEDVDMKGARFCSSCRALVGAAGLTPKR